MFIPFTFIFKSMMKHSTIAYRIISVRIAAIAILGSSIISGCEDLLPDYGHPDNIFAAEFIRTDTDTLEFSEPRDGSGGSLAAYTTYHVIFSITNMYEETFQYQINPKGTITIEIPSVASGKSGVAVTVTELQSTNAYNPSSGVLTLDPGASIFFRMRIDPKLENGFYLHKYAGEKTSRNMPGQFYLVKTYNPLSVTARFTIQLAPDLPAVTAEEIISINLKGRFPYSP
jgi:hypothetical protein